LPIPTYKEAYVHFNAVTWNPMPYEESTILAGQMVKEGYWTLPNQQRGRPTLGDLTEEKITHILEHSHVFQDCQLVSMVEVNQCRLEYIAPLEVILLEHTQTKEQRVVAYRNGIKYQDETDILQRLLEQGKLIFPDDVQQLTADSVLELPTAMEEPLIHLTQKYLLIQEQLHTAASSLDTHEEQLAESLQESEQLFLRARIDEFKQEIAILRRDRDNMFEDMKTFRIEVLQTDEHHQFLLETLRKAESELIIISPWINPQACNNEFCTRIEQAVSRGVHIRIGYYIGPEGNSPQAARKWNNMQEAKRSIKFAEQRAMNKKSSTGKVEFIKTQGTHQKILICDHSYAVVTSFNWLSYKGEKDSYYREETGIIIYHPEQIDTILQEAERALQAGQIEK
jgi:PLD-like domain